MLPPHQALLSRIRVTGRDDAGQATRCHLEHHHQEATCVRPTHRNVPAASAPPQPGVAGQGFLGLIRLDAVSGDVVLVGVVPDEPDDPYRYPPLTIIAFVIVSMP
jgi:hypothetical protein